MVGYGTNRALQPPLGPSLSRRGTTPSIFIFPGKPKTHERLCGKPLAFRPRLLPFSSSAPAFSEARKAGVILWPTAPAVGQLNIPHPPPLSRPRGRGVPRAG